MQITSILFLLLLLLSGKLPAELPEKFEKADKQILENIFRALERKGNASTSELVVAAGMQFLNTPYVAHTLESDKEELIINLRELDCTTFAENCLAIARSVKSGDPSFKTFVAELQKLRYRNGKINKYPSRLHYFSDWIYENTESGYLDDLSRKLCNTPYPLNVNFMSTHPDSYKQLKTNPAWVKRMEGIESEIQKRTMFYVPKDKIKDIESELRSGDIIGITTSVKGLDVTHVGILVKVNGRIHLMHASSAAMKVVISEEPLSDYLTRSKSNTGIMVTRPK
ncbi:MAG: N-acetylmuramoyl-L-alanine amidase-like domain-containing protein [Draconibacterium sp.]